MTNQFRELGLLFYVCSGLFTFIAVSGKLYPYYLEYGIKVVLPAYGVSFLMCGLFAYVGVNGYIKSGKQARVKH